MTMLISISEKSDFINLTHLLSRSDTEWHQWAKIITATVLKFSSFEGTCDLHTGFNENLPIYCKCY
jgi:hypothetical protein